VPVAFSSHTRLAVHLLFTVFEGDAWKRTFFDLFVPVFYPFGWADSAVSPDARFACIGIIVVRFHANQVLIKTNPAVLVLVHAWETAVTWCSVKNNLTHIVLCIQNKKISRSKSAKTLLFSPVISTIPV
jgi:hypothetical protein